MRKRYQKNWMYVYQCRQVKKLFTFAYIFSRIEGFGKLHEESTESSYIADRVDGQRTGLFKHYDRLGWIGSQIVN